MVPDWYVFTTNDHCVAELAGWKDKDQVREDLREANERCPSEAPHRAIKDGDVVE